MSRLVDELLARNIEGRGLARTLAYDGQSAGVVQLVRDLLVLFEMAMLDEDVDPVTAERVLRLVLYGAVPNPYEVEARRDVEARLVYEINRRPFDWPPG